MPRSKSYRGGAPGHFKIPKTGIGLQGLDEVINNVQTEIDKVKDRTMSGLLRAAALVRKDMDETPPVIPVDLGNLSNSWFVATSRGAVARGRKPKFRKSKRGSEQTADVNKLQQGHVEAIVKAHMMLSTAKGEAIAMGFSAYYAPYVHENLQAKFKRPNSGAKFFQAALRRNKRKILQLIAFEAEMRATGYATGGAGRAVRSEIKKEFE